MESRILYDRIQTTERQIVCISTKFEILIKCITKKEKKRKVSVLFFAWKNRIRISIYIYT